MAKQIIGQHQLLACDRERVSKTSLFSEKILKERDRNNTSELLLRIIRQELLDTGYIKICEVKNNSS